MVTPTKRSTKKVTKYGRKTKAKKTVKGGKSKTRSKSSKSGPNLKKIAGIAGAGIATVATLYSLYKRAKASGQLDRFKNIIGAVATPPVPQQQMYPPTSPSGLVQMESMGDLNRPSYYSASNIIPPPINRGYGRSPNL